MQDNRSDALAITAYSLASALGRTRAATVEALAGGRSGLAPPPMALPFATVCGVPPGEPSPLPAELAVFDSRVARIVADLVAPIRGEIDRAVARWGPGRVGIFLATSTAGILTTEQAWRTLQTTGALPASYDFARQHAYDAMLHVVRGLTGASGPGFVTSTACSSSAKVFGSATRLIRAGLIDAAIVGGADTLCEVTLRGFHALGALDAEACRPFASGRAGINVGEGGALVLVERSGDARARLLAVGESSDAHHISAPHPEGAGARAAMEEALVRAGLRPSEVDCVNAHGTGTLQNDRAEALAIGATLGDQVPVVSTKGYTGHMLGAAGAVEAVLAVLTLEEGFVPASLGCEPVDPEVAVNVVRERTSLAARVVASNSFAFGGSNVTVLLGAA